MGLVGASELAEIALIVATELDVTIITVIDSSVKKPRILGIPVTEKITDAAQAVDAVMITSIAQPQATYEAALSVFGNERVYLPSVLATMVARSNRSPSAPKKRSHK